MRGLRSVLSLPPAGGGVLTMAQPTVYILAVGWEYLVVLSTTGSVLRTVPLLGAPLYPPVLGDFTNDGLTDVLLVRRNGCVGMEGRAKCAGRGGFQ